MDADLILESFNLDPSRLFGESYKFSVLYEANQKEFSKVMSDTNKDVSKKNVFQKIWGFIKKIFGLIGKGINAIINYIQSLFGKKKQTVDQIASELSIKPTSAPVASKKGEPSKKASVRVPIKSNPKSEVKMPSFIDCVIKPISLKLNKDESITISITDVKDTQEGNRFGGFVPGHEVVRTSDVGNVISLMVKPDVMDEMVNVASIMTKNIKDDPAEFIRVYDRWQYNFNGIQVTMDTTVTLKQMREFQLKLNEIMKMLEDVDVPYDNIKTDNQTLISTLNRFAGFASAMQMGMNTVSGALQTVYTIDGKYINAIDNIDKLSEFIGRCIEIGVPSKYISYNAYVISTPSIKGDGSEGDEDSPRWGQSRVVLFPKSNDRLVYKIALSGFGIRANKSESLITDKFVRNGGGDLLSRVLHNTANSAIISAQRVTIKKTPNYNEINDLKDRLTQFTQDHSIPLDITADIHEDNVGYKNGHCVAIDYANTNRVIPT